MARIINGRIGKIGGRSQPASSENATSSSDVQRCREPRGDTIPDLSSRVLSDLQARRASGQLGERLRSARDDRTRVLYLQRFERSKVSLSFTLQQDQWESSIWTHCWIVRVCRSEETSRQGQHDEGEIDSSREDKEVSKDRPTTVPATILTVRADFPTPPDPITTDW